MLSIPNKLTLHTRIHIILVAWVSFFPPAVSEHVFLRNTQEDLWLSTWFLEARKAFILKFAKRGKQTFTLNTVCILTRHLEAMTREAGFCDDENAMDGKEVLGKLPRSH
ncbi:hypothetical protein NC651_029815 [Populus alba x Populus x berolinensis]|nr:hypothetical protein NC651_029815 [Populus alba x Populus x berolinensis]